MIYNYQRLKRNKLAQQLAFELKEAERLSELDTLKTRFFTNVSHEFRTPLTLLIGPLDNLKKKFPEEKLIGLMQRNLERLQILINQLLDLSKLEAGKMEPQIQQADLAFFLKTLLASFESLGESKSIVFNYPENLSSHTAFFDADKTEKIVSNLVSNAFKFTPEKGQIDIAINFTESHFSLVVQDTGIGIEAERLPHIFDRFYQVDNSNHRNYEGTGIGLALVKELVEVLKGNIKAESRIGKGTTFTITIPCDKATWGKYLINEPLIIKEPEKVARLTQPKDIADAPVNNELPVLLIVEDNADLRTYIRSHFEAIYQVTEAVDGQDGYEKAIEIVPDLVICDLMMPRLDGFEFCKLIKSDIRTDHIPVIMLTAKAALEDRLEGLELGADDYLAKPFNTEELQIRVRNLINIRQVLREKYSQRIAESIIVTTAKDDSIDSMFLRKLNDIIEKNISDSSFNVEILAEEMHMTSVQLRRKLKAVTNQTAIEFIRNYRLEKAAVMLQNKLTTVSEVAYMVGFESLSYFSKVYQEKFGKFASERQA
jgi:DNA-binding response OmpR family regulator/two-component sensor histidine kinase